MQRAWPKKDYLKIGNLAKKLNDLLGKSIIFEAINNEFASCFAAQNDNVCKMFTASTYGSIDGATNF